MNTYYSFRKIFSPVAIITAIFAVFILLFVGYGNIYAITTTTITDNTPLFGGQKLKASSDATAVLKVQFGSDSNAENLNALSIGFTIIAGTPTWTSGQAVSSELLDLATTNGGITLWKENGAAPGFQSATDTQVTLAATPVYSASNIFSITPATPPALLTDDVYYVVLKSDSSGTTNNNAFTVTIPSNGVTTSATPPTITPVTSRTITIDTTAPTLNTGTSSPADASTGVPISTFIHMTFSEQLDQTTLNPSNITLTAGGAVSGSIRPFPDGFDFVVSNPPTYTVSTSFAKFNIVSSSFFQIFGSSPIFPQGNYSAPVVGDIVFAQRETFPAELGLVTNATLTSGTFAINGFSAFNPQQITKAATPSATGAVTDATALTTGDIIVVNTTANPTAQKYDWHIVTTGANANAAGLRLDESAVAPTYVSGSRFSTITPTATATDNGATAGQVLAVSVGDLVFVKIGAGAYGWHQVTSAGNLSSDATENTAFLDDGVADPGIAVASQMSKLASAANGLVSESATVFSFGDIVFAKTTANAANNNAYNFHIITNGATGANSASLRFDNSPGSLTTSTAYTLTMTTGVKDSAGNALASNQVMTFTTGSTGGTNTTPPFVQSSQPQGGSQTHPINAPVRLTFSVDMASSGGGDITSGSNIGLFLDNFGVPGASVTTTKSYDSATKTVTLTPNSSLTASTGYIVKVNTTATSTTSAAFIQPFFMFFRTPSGVADATAPTVLGVSPATTVTGVALGTVVTAGFSEDMDPSTIISGRVKLALTSDLNATVAGTVSYSPQSRSASFAPSTALTANTSYTFTVVSGGSGVKDLSGNALAANFTSTFTTTATADTTKPLLTFANADNFSLAVTFSEQVKTGGGPNAVDNIANYTFESPVGSSISLGGKTVIYEAGTKTARINGLSLQNGNTYKVTVAPVAQDLSGNVMETTGTPALNTQFGTVANSTTTGGQIGPGGGTIDPSMQGMNPSRVMPMSRGAGATSNYHVEFLGSTSIPATGQIVLSFPAGFTLTNTAAITAGTLSFCNADLNGPATGAPTIGSIAVNNDAGTVTINTATAATGANAFLCMDLSGIVNSTVPSSTGYSVSIQTKDMAANNRATIQNITTAPFFLGTSGTRTLTVNVFKDANSNGVNNASEGLNGVTVFLFSPATGGQEATTANSTVDGVATFSNLADGDYMIGIKPNATINVAFNSAPQPITISGNTVKNFALSNAAAITISGTITGTNGTKVDVFASSPNGFTKKTVTLTGGADAYSLPVSPNTSYNVGVGPAMPESSFTPGSPPPPMPDFTFMPPPNVNVNVVSSNVSQAGVAGLAFVLSTASKTITGTVVDSSATGVSGAGIFCRPVATSTNGTASGFGTGAQTNTSGAFTVKVTEGVYLCAVFKPGMPPVSEKQITVGASANIPTSLSFVLDVATTLTITGTIKDDNGNAIPYAGVSGRKVVSTSNTTAVGGDSGNFVGGPTDANGAYTLYVSAGTWVVEAFAPGFGRLGTKTISISTTSSSGQDFSAQTLAMGTITGTATQAATAVQGVMVRAENADATSGNMAVTGSDGTYTLKVPAGTYTLTCYFPGVGEGTPITGVAVTANTTTSGKNCTQAAPITITVNVTDGTNPISNAGVEVRDSNGRGNFTSTSVTTGANAVYTVVVPPGTYTVRVGHPAYGNVGTTTGVNTTRSITYTASAGQLYAVTGTVTGDGANLSSAWVSLSGTPTGQTNNIFLGGQTATNGTFSISVPPGIYKVRADKPGYKSPTESTATVTTAIEAVGTIALTTAARTITGTVTLDGSGVSNAFVDATDGVGGYAVAQTNASGAYTLNVDNGTWSIRAHSHGYEGGPLSVVVSGNSPTGQTVTLTAISGFTIKAERPETITPSAGGFLTNTDIGSNFQVEFPANALGTGSNATTVTTRSNTAMPKPASGSILSKNAISIDAVGSDGSPISSLNDEIIITIPYDEADLPTGTTEASLVIGVWNDAIQTYETLSTTVNTTDNTLTATVSHLSDFAPLVPTSTAVTATVSSGGGGGSGMPAIPLSSLVPIGSKVQSPLAIITPSVDSNANPKSSLKTSFNFGTKTLKKGSKGEAVKELQRFLNQVLSLGLVVDGVFGPNTTKVMKQWQTDHGLTVDGLVGPATKAQMNSNVTSPVSSSTTYDFGSAVLKNGSRGEAVKELQRFLNQVLSLGLVVDGKLGPKTIAVIKKWQKANGLVADGLIGAKTKAKMNASIQ